MRLNLVSLFVLLGIILCVHSAPVLTTTDSEDNAHLNDVQAVDNAGKSAIQIKGHSRNPGKALQSAALPSKGLQAIPIASRSLFPRFFKDGKWKFWKTNQPTTLQPHVQPIQVHVQTESSTFGKPELARKPHIRKPSRTPPPVPPKYTLNPAKQKVPNKYIGPDKHPNGPRPRPPPKKA